jgi:hypothetical protein
MDSVQQYRYEAVCVARLLSDHPLHAVPGENAEHTHLRRNVNDKGVGMRQKGDGRVTAGKSVQSEAACKQ